MDKHLQVNELEAVVVREIFSLYHQHRSALSVMRHLNENGRATKRYQATNGNVLREAKVWKKESVLRVLRNPIYAGFIPYRNEVYEGEHEAIIDTDLFTRTQALIEILHRKNALFFRTKNGAYVGNLFMSLIHITELNAENPFEYLVALLENHHAVAMAPDLWMPWNFRQALDSLHAE